MYLWLAVKTVFCTCGSDQRTNDFKKVKSHYKISKLGKLPAIASESSGLSRDGDGKTFWTHNDSGGKPELYQVDLTGKLVTTKPVPGAHNVDWEDLSHDEEGRFYIGDFGNNGPRRTSFVIYKFDPRTNTSEQITFRYPHPVAVASKTPADDCESLFYHKGSLYLFSKNWQKGQLVKLYRLPAVAGEYTATAVDSIRIDSPVTSAAVSPDGKTFALLTYGKVLLFDVARQDIDFSKPRGCFRFSHKQTEAIDFLNNTDMLITNEQGSMYRATFH